MFAKLFGGARPAPAISTNRFRLGVTRLEPRENPAGPRGGPVDTGGYDPLCDPDPLGPESEPGYYDDWEHNPNNPNYQDGDPDNEFSTENMFKTSQAMFDRWQVVLHTFVGPPAEQLMPTPEQIAAGFY